MSWMPAANVFGIGDVLILASIAVLLAVSMHSMRSSLEVAKSEPSTGS
jgi:hypothetical protein